MISSLTVKENYKFIGSDFSGQEPRLLAHYSQDKNMIDTYLSGKDIYSQIATIVYNLPYDECTEFDKNGKFSVDGKARRSACKPIILGIMYGRGTASIAEQIGCSSERATEILDTFFDNFPGVKTWIDSCYEFAKKYGYVYDYTGRRRRLPDILLPQFEVTEVGKKDKTSFNPLLFCKNIIKPEVNPLISKYLKQLNSAKKEKDIRQIIKDALKDHIDVERNGGKIAQAERQCVNARIQGGAATLTKKASIDIDTDKQMNDWDCHIVINVHDELICEVKEEFADVACERLCYLMCQAAKELGIVIPMKCDGEISTHWYSPVLAADIKKSMDKKNLSFEEVLSEEYPFITDSDFIEEIRSAL